MADSAQSTEQATGEATGRPLRIREAYIEQDRADGFQIVDFAALGIIPRDVNLFPAYIEGLKRAIFHWKQELRDVRSDIQEWRDEQADEIAGERAEPTEKQKGRNEPGSLLYSNDDARERALREREREDMEFRQMLEQEAGLENIINRYESRLSRARRDWKLRLLEHLAKLPRETIVAFNAIQVYED